MYHQIARNKRKSVIVVAAFFIIWAAIGYVIGFIASGVSGGISGVIIAGIIALLVVLWSLTLGQQTVLAVSGAQPVTQEQAPVLYDIVSTLATGDGLPMPKVYIIDDPSPNAFATGQVLYAFKEAGVDTRSPEFLRGVKYLLGTQEDTGAWPGRVLQPQ